MNLLRLFRKKQPSLQEWYDSNPAFDVSRGKPRIKEVHAYNETCRAFEIHYMGKGYRTELTASRAFVKLRFQVHEIMAGRPIWHVWD